MFITAVCTMNNGDKNKKVIVGMSGGVDSSVAALLLKEHMLNQNQLSKILFPLGDKIKKEVRKIASNAGLYTADRKDSTGICFIGEKNFKEFLKNYLPAQPGKIRSISGEVLGNHDGLMFYTLGQRKGLGIGGTPGGEPWFVAEKDLKNNILYVAQGRNNPALYSNSLVASDVHWISEKAPNEDFSCNAKFRYRQPDQEVRVRLIDDNKCKVEFKRPRGQLLQGSLLFSIKTRYA